ncbi:MAG: hypothetical protein GXX96_04715 [Planctomycetaceae bacterium]|nr:hypothetical protein [Planctomycetaceae bacterium]
MNHQTQKGRQAPSRQFHHAERRQAPHRRPPSSKEAAGNIPGRDQVEARGQKPLPVAQPMRRAARTLEGRQQGARVAREAAAPSPTETPARSRPQPTQSYFDIRAALTVFGFSVAAVLILLFGLDLTMGVPLERISLPMDVSYLLCGIILAGLSWSCWRDLR